MFAKQSGFWRDFFSAMAESSKKLKSSDLILTFLVCSNLNKSALVCELSVSCTRIRARDLIFLQLTSKQ